MEEQGAAGAPQGGGEGGAGGMYEWEEQDRFSFEDSERFEEVQCKLCFIFVLQTVPKLNTI